MFYRDFEENDTYDMYGAIGNPYMNYSQGFYQNYNPVRTTWQKDLYPEIYNIIYPIITSVISRKNIRLTEENLERLVMEVYEKVEGMEKQTEEELLKDLIRILIIREFYPRKRPVPRLMQVNNREFYHPFPEEYM